MQDRYLASKMINRNNIDSLKKYSSIFVDIDKTFVFRNRIQ